MCVCQHLRLKLEETYVAEATKIDELYKTFAQEAFITSST